MAVFGVEELKRKFDKMEKLADDVPKIIKEETINCYTMAFNNAPLLKGRLRKAMIVQLNFPNEGWVISPTPPHASGFPYHILIERDEYAQAFPKYNIKLEGAGRVHFMEKTADEFRIDFIKRINGKIEFSII